MNEPRPIDKARAGRFVIAILDRNRDKAEAVVTEAIEDDTFPELFDTLSGGLMTVLRLAIGDDNLRQWASDWVLYGSQSG